MANIIDYAAEHTETFTELAYNDVDALVLASLAYQRMPGIVPTYRSTLQRLGTLTARIRSLKPWKTLAGFKGIFHPPFEGPTLREVCGVLHPKDFKPSTGYKGTADPKYTYRLFRAVENNPRYDTIRMGAYSEHTSVEEQTQFAAVTALRPDGVLAVLFRGTDDSFVGWKEDFNMSFQYPVPAQEYAADYLNNIARLWRGPIVLAGHSKGGNLAVYAAMNAPQSIQPRIIKVYSLDGPGFPESVVGSPEYERIMGRIIKIVPDSSIVGMLLQTPEPCVVVTSDERGLMQHLPYSWQIEHGDLVRLPEISPGSQYFNRALNEWLATLTYEQRQRTIDALFTLLMSTGAERIPDMFAALPKTLPHMLGSFAGLSDMDRRNVFEALNLLWRASRTRASRPRIRLPWDSPQQHGSQREELPDPYGHADDHENHDPGIEQGRPGVQAAG